MTINKTTFVVGVGIAAACGIAGCVYKKFNTRQNNIGALAQAQTTAALKPETVVPPLEGRATKAPTPPESPRATESTSAPRPATPP
ncbi:MAG: hypothetical protein ACOYK9_04240, partial [Chlamydiia bacterium]